MTFVETLQHPQIIGYWEVSKKTHEGLIHTHTERERERERRFSCHVVISSDNYCVSIENLLLRSRSNDYDVMLADFGLSRYFGESMIMKTTCGTPTYIAPEILQSDKGYGPEVCVYVCFVCVCFVSVCFCLFLSFFLPPPSLSLS